MSYLIEWLYATERPGTQCPLGTIFTGTKRVRADQLDRWLNNIHAAHPTTEVFVTVTQLGIPAES